MGIIILQPTLQEKAVKSKAIFSDIMMIILAHLKNLTLSP